MIIMVYNNVYVHINKPRHYKNKSFLTDYHEHMMLYHQPNTKKCLLYYNVDHANDRAE